MALSTQAQAELDKCVARFRTTLIEEAERLELSQRSAGALPDITPSMVHDANILVRRNYHQTKRSKLLVILDLVTAAALIAVGVATENLDKPWGPFVFAGTVAVALIAYFVSISKA